MHHNRWYYFLSIEKDFIRTIDYVEVSPDNNAAFSNQYAKLLLLIGSEVDVVAKMLCSEIDPDASLKNIHDCKSVLTRAFEGFHTVEIGASRYGLTLRPWESWGPENGSSPLWWTAYNQVKHHRDTKFQDANQANALNALSGLLALLLYLFRKEDHLQPYPQLLDFGFPSYIVDSGNLKLPGVK